MAFFNVLYSLFTDETILKAMPLIVLEQSLLLHCYLSLSFSLWLLNFQTVSIFCSRPVSAVFKSCSSLLVALHFSLLFLSVSRRLVWENSSLSTFIFLYLDQQGCQLLPVSFVKSSWWLSRMSRIYVLRCICFKLRCLPPFHEYSTFESHYFEIKWKEPIAVFGFIKSIKSFFLILTRLNVYFAAYCWKTLFAIHFVVSVFILSTTLS